MSKITIDIPDDRWFDAEWNIRPKDREICAVIRGAIPEICVYIESEESFYTSEVWTWINYIYKWSEIEKWKPLGLPKKDDEIAKREIEELLREYLVSD